MLNAAKHTCPGGYASARGMLAERKRAPERNYSPFNGVILSEAKNIDYN